MLGSKHERPGDPCTMIIFGASGDLTKRLLLPSIYNLACDGLLPHNFAIIGTARPDMTNEAFRDQMSEDIRRFATRDFNEAIWDEFVRNLYYLPGDFDDPAAYQRLAQCVRDVDAKHQTLGNHLFYLAVPPVVFSLIAHHLGVAGLAREEKGWSRLIVEKPFGNDIESAVTLNRELQEQWREDQIWRIDHYLGKETVQNILAFRFANGIFEPLWNRHHVDHVQFTVAEKVGVEGRGNYYERSGVLRDMMQNHMFQMLAYVAMEPPSSFHADDIRNAKVEVLKAIHPFAPEEVIRSAVRGQYSGGTMDGNIVLGYREEPDVAKDSRTETFAALRLFIDNWRWAGVPFYLRSGKRLPMRRTEIAIQFKRAPEVLFRNTAVDQLEANQLLLHIQPEQGIELIFEAKVPGPTMQLQTVRMHFEYQEAFHAGRGTGYETLIYDCMIDDPTLFSRADLVETAWKVAQPMLDVWTSLPARNFPNYPAGTWGPKDADELIDRDRRQWRRL
ncbi:MAG: glucose-6-phosphate dehydrogenase [Nitrospinae bacterium]|nr:glucose-6-phosphate dehydrogenase [Nitrospinota bacterium]